MLSPADARVVERDPRLPGLATLLDAEVFADMLRRLCPDRRIDGATARYLRYKSQTSCLAAYDVDLPDGRVGVYARCHREDLAYKAENARLLPEVRGPLGPGILTDAASAIAVFVYPNDYEIQSLRKLFDPVRASARMRRIIPSYWHLRRSHPEVLRYKPERRFVGRVSGRRGPPAVVRLYPEAGFDEVCESVRAFHDAGDLHVPRLIGESARYCSLAYEWIDGRALPELLFSGADPGPLLERIAAALWSLHQQHPRLRAMCSAQDYGERLAGACVAIESVDPAMGARAARTADHVRRAIADAPWRCRAVHGDFTAEQVLVDDDRVTVLDLDRALYGDTGMDLGDFVAGLIADALRGQLSMERAAELGHEFVDAYRHAGGTAAPASVRAFTAGALLMQATEPFRYRHPDWPADMAALLDSAEGMVIGATIGA